MPLPHALGSADFFLERRNFNASPKRNDFEIGAAGIRLPISDNLLLDSDGKVITLSRFSPNEDELQPFELAAIAATLHLLSGGLSLHASAASFADSAAAFAGDSGAGKSTLAAKIAQKGGSVVADDICLINFDMSGAYLHGDLCESYLDGNSRALLDLPDPDEASTLKKPVSLSKFKPSTFVALQKIYILSESALCISRLNGLDAFRSVLRHIWYPRLTQQYLGQRHLHLISNLIERVPVFQLPSWRAGLSFACEQEVLV